MKRSLHKLTFLSLPLVLALSFTNCKRSFLEVEPPGELTENSIAGDPTIARRLVTGVYSQLYQGGFGDDVHGIIFCMATDVASDDADKGSTPADQSPEAVGFDNFTSDLNSRNFYVDRLWNGHYRGINSANNALKVLEGSTIDNVTKRTLIGEVRFLRAYFYFNLVRLFGGVPLSLRVPESLADAASDEFNVRATRDQVYTAIINDLQYGVDSLPAKGDPGTEPGRANKGAAQSLLAKVYLYQRNFQKAYELADAVIASNKYGLVTNYAQNFRNKALADNNVESVFEIQTGVDANCNASVPFYVVAQGPRAGGVGGWADLGFGLNTPSDNLAAAYEANDVRRDATILFIQPNGTTLWDGFQIPPRNAVQNDRYNYKAYFGRRVDPYCGSGNTDRLPKNVKIVRYAEVLLIHAEAGLQTGHAGEAQNDLNAIRTRAGLTSVPATQQSVWNERRLELAMEQDRFFDIVRQGRAGTILRALGKTFVDNKNEVFPIPQTQIDLSGGRINQNNGY
ncbi:RagB/SusD family nutrient uptake outer membrane protein [Flaviaesturariibacter aridisoli]|uniref:RagB/SusD family nutrient uptake outer membrane protein n=1 Tax=Flaviaesturariibacter aridisoli TaxID=2545761 RepID=A0A4R4DZW4_9BACT|nr:RagB/SusD family nutrient uptake outer membrane protein [Flaviaesturariibacter aridisoli]TCZ72241.1 RagB/SusD family nutrient uptake outer membrane protein [Flaviaesturariibacter aridisoli]